jgi:hypothetical protein
MSVSFRIMTRRLANRFIVADGLGSVLAVNRDGDGGGDPLKASAWYTERLGAGEMVSIRQIKDKVRNAKTR